MKSDKGHTLHLVAQIYYNGMWGDPGFIYSSATQGGSGLKATQIQGNNIDKIVVQSGIIGPISYSYNSGNGFNMTSGTAPTSAPFRVIAVCLD